MGELMASRCSTNNRTDTVLNGFLKATAKYGLPSRVRSDKGLENTSVSLFMLQHPLRGPGHGSMIVVVNGNSTGFSGLMWFNIVQSRCSVTLASYKL